ncbi:MAG: hypothetical protein AB6733_07750 [Clostridiaceae bacterium]
MVDSCPNVTVVFIGGDRVRWYMNRNTLDKFKLWLEDPNSNYFTWVTNHNNTIYVFKPSIAYVIF